MQFPLFRRLFSKAVSKAAAASDTGGSLIYAIGDIHGRLDLLNPLLDKILDDAATLGGGRPVIIFVGDYVDRGPDSRGVIDRIIALAATPGLEVRTLKGNHEEQLLSFLDDPRSGPPWMEFGGAQTLLSYGIVPPKGRTDMEVWDEARLALAKALPPEHLQFLNGLELAITCGDYLFVHAGVRPGVPLNQQSERDLMWIREEFLAADRACDKVVVHGHTPEASPYVGRHRIGIDTGAYATATLTAVRLLGAERMILQASPRTA
jgi:serine/threonine protein phosphatase 1